MTELVAPTNGRRLGARFTLLEKLGVGGQGEVWRAHDDSRGIDIALKVPASADGSNEAVLAAFEREHFIASRLDHASVLKVFAPHRSGDGVVLPMELANGGDLRRLRGAGYLEIVPVLLDIAQALEHAHERGIIHRDLKPGNVLFDARGRVKLADFGAAGITNTTPEVARQQGLSPFTASPEQLRGESPTETDDIYGLGALAYELLSGYPPYYPHFDIRRAQEEPVPKLVPTRQIPPLLSRLVMRMLSKDKHQRPRSMRGVIDELDASLNDTLAFDFESIVDPGHGAPSAAVSIGPRTVRATSRNGAGGAPPAGDISVTGVGSPTTAKNADKAGAGPGAPSASPKPPSQRAASQSRSSARPATKRAGPSPPTPPTRREPKRFVESWGDDDEDEDEENELDEAASSEQRAADQQAAANNVAGDVPNGRDAVGTAAGADAKNVTGGAAAAVAGAPESGVGTLSRDVTAAGSLGNGAKAVARGAASVDAVEPNVASETGAVGALSSGNTAHAAGGEAPGSEGTKAGDRAMTSDDLGLIPELLVANSLVARPPNGFGPTPTPPLVSVDAAVRKATGLQVEQPQSITESNRAFETRPSATPGAWRADLNATQALPLQGGMATGEPVNGVASRPDMNATQAFPLSGATPSDVANPLAEAPQADPNATRVLSGLQAKPSQPDPTFHNLTQVLPESAVPNAQDTLAKMRQSDPTWANLTQVLPEDPAMARAREVVQKSGRQVPDWLTLGRGNAQRSTTKQTPAQQAAPPQQATPPPQTRVDSPWPPGSPIAYQQQRHTGEGATARPNQPARADAAWPPGAPTQRRFADVVPPAASNPRDLPAQAARADSTLQPTAAQPLEQQPGRGDTAWPPGRQAPAHQQPQLRRQRTPAQQLQALNAQLMQDGPAAASYAAIAADASTQRREANIEVRHEPMTADGPATVGRGRIGNVGPSMTVSDQPIWGDLDLDAIPRVHRLEPIKRRTWPLVLLGILAGIAVAVFYWLPRYTGQSLPIDLSAFTHSGDSATATGSAPSDDATNTSAGLASTAPTANNPEEKLRASRQVFDRRLMTLEARGAGVWGGPEFAMAKTRAAESVGAHDAGNTQIAIDRLIDASNLLDSVEGKASQALSAQIAVGQKALAAGQGEVANQAFDLARRIDPNDRRIADGQRRTKSLNDVLPLLADAQNAESARNFSRAAQDYSQVLLLDPSNDKARSGLARANADLGEDNYAKAVGSGYAALGAGRLDDARAAFNKARAARPNGSEALEGQKRVDDALFAKGYSSLRQRAAGLESQERWDEAVEAYNSALQSDPSLAFAQEGKNRAAARAQLNTSLQALIDRPERLASQSVREQARALLVTAGEQPTSGPVLRSQIARIELLLPDYEKTGYTRAIPQPDVPSIRPVAAWRSDTAPSKSDTPTSSAAPARPDNANRSDASARADAALDRLDALARGDTQPHADVAAAHVDSLPRADGAPADADTYIRGEMDRPVHLSLVSDNATDVQIESIGEFGTFAKRDIELKPGRYTVIGTRDGYRVVRRDITVAPGQGAQTIRVSCSDPI